MGRGPRDQGAAAPMTNESRLASPGGTCLSGPVSIPPLSRSRTASPLLRAKMVGRGPPDPPHEALQTTPSRLVRRPSPTGAAAPFVRWPPTLCSNWRADLRVGSRFRRGAPFRGRGVSFSSSAGIDPWGYRTLLLPRSWRKRCAIRLRGGGGKRGGCAVKVCADGASPSSRVFERRCRAVEPEWGAVPGTKALPRE
jgi:hypothetical protein